MYWKTNSIRNYYDKFAAEYDVKHGVSLYGQAYNFSAYYEPFLESSIPEHGTVLELGCGTGVYTKWLSERGLQVVAMDISSKMIEQARQKAPNAKFVLGDCENPAAYIDMAEYPEKFDAIVGFNTFSYYLHKSEALANYYEMLKPRGKFIAIDMNGSSFYYRLMSWININEARQWLLEIRQSNLNYLLSIFGKNAFKIDEIKRFSFIPNGLSRGKVKILAPIDRILLALPFMQRFAMRIAYVASKSEKS